jgi:hypothetical protein
VRIEQRLVVLQTAEKVRPHAHHRTQARIWQRMPKDFGEAWTLMLLGSHVKLLALVDVEKKARRFGLIELVVAGLRGVKQIAERSLAVAQKLDPAVMIQWCRRRNGRPGAV